MTTIPANTMSPVNEEPPRACRTSLDVAILMPPTVTVAIAQRNKSFKRKSDAERC
jgi:hypothetical protein